MGSGLTGLLLPSALCHLLGLSAVTLLVRGSRPLGWPAVVPPELGSCSWLLAPPGRALWGCCTQGPQACGGNASGQCSRFRRPGVRSGLVPLEAQGGAAPGPCPASAVRHRPCWSLARRGTAPTSAPVFARPPHSPGSPSYKNASRVGSGHHPSRFRFGLISLRPHNDPNLPTRPHAEVLGITALTGEFPGAAGGGDTRQPVPPKVSTSVQPQALHASVTAAGSPYPGRGAQVGTRAARGLLGRGAVGRERVTTRLSSLPEEDVISVRRGQKDPGLGRRCWETGSRLGAGGGGDYLGINVQRQQRPSSVGDPSVGFHEGGSREKPRTCPKSFRSRSLSQSPTSTWK